ncbi:MAG TPA: 50S ribosomal protein L17 [Candidatus Woesebacteria bacterium]|nr:50S ribosomal protein L17 [Candidatus Woesebacteria bacterium]
MRHRVSSKAFNCDTNQRKALLMNLTRSLFEHGEIETTQAKGKEVKRLADKLLAVAKQNTLAAKRELHAFFGKRDVVNTLTQVISPHLDKKESGFISLESAGKRRGDNSHMVKVTLLNKPDKLGSFKKSQQLKKES